jgi:adenylate cyclase
VVLGGRVYEDLVGRLDVAFTDRGPMTLKNIERPAHVSALPGAAPTPPRAGLTLPDKPSVAVLPFVDMSPDAE